MPKTPFIHNVIAKTVAANDQLELELVQYKQGRSSISFNLDVDHDTVWATQQQIADLFEKDRSTIAGHIQTVLKEGELLEEAVCGKFPQTGADGKTYQVSHYNLDMILSVGYRVSSPKATEFRRWATSTLRSYLIDGYAINETRLRDDPSALRRLAAHIRKLRAEEQNVYAAVRTVFKDGSIDYDPKAEACRRFYVVLQDKFHYAVTASTAAELILERADHRHPNMGLQTFVGNLPSLDEIQIGKNYLDADELYVLHMLCEQFLLYAESKAMRGQTLTMSQMGKKLDDLLAVSDYPVFPGYKTFLKDKAINHAKAEYALFLKRLKNDDVKRIA